MCVPIFAGIGAALGASASGAAATGMFATSVALTAGTTAMQFMSQRTAAKEQNMLYQANAVEAQKAYVRDLTLMDIREQQQAAQAKQQAFEASREGLRAKGLAQAGADQVSGVNVAELLNDFDRNTAERQQNILYNRQAGSLQGVYERQGLRDQFASRVNSVSRAHQPSVLGSLLTFGGGVMPAVERYGQLKGWYGTNRVGVS